MIPNRFPRNAAFVAAMQNWCNARPSSASRGDCDDPCWGPEVRSYALRTNDGVILFDPIAPPDELTRDGSVQVVLTAEWHRRDAEKLGCPVRGEDLPRGERPAWFLPR